MYCLYIYCYGRGERDSKHHDRTIRLGHQAHAYKLSRSRFAFHIHRCICSYCVWAKLPLSKPWVLVFCFKFMSPCTAKDSVLLRPFEVTLGPSLLNIANNTSFQPQKYLLFLSPSYRWLGGSEDSPDLYLQILFPSFWWIRSGVIAKIICVFVVAGGRFQPCSEGCSVESKEIMKIGGRAGPRRAATRAWSVPVRG